MNITPSPAPSPSHYDLLAVLFQIGHQQLFTCIGSDVHQRSDGDLQLQLGRILAMFAFGHAQAAVFRLVTSLALVSPQSAGTGISRDNHVSALATVPSERSSKGNKLFPAEGHRTSSPFASF